MQCQFHIVHLFCCRNRCEDRRICIEKLSLVLPETPPYVPRQFGRCAVIGNSGDLLKTKFGREIDTYDAVFRENGAPIQVRLMLSFVFASSDALCTSLLGAHISVFLLLLCRTTLSTWVEKVHFVSSTEVLPKLLIKL